MVSATKLWNRLTPSHASKGAKRYRYYVSQALIKKPGRAAEGPTRLPADELEELVISQLQSFLQSPQRMQDVLCSRTGSSVETKHAAECAERWAAATVAQVGAVVPAIVKRVIVRDNRIELQLSRSAIREAVTQQASLLRTVASASRRWDRMSTAEVGTSIAYPPRGDA
jgi:site-specific DNA recombinase